jgi:hypothetical protein
MKTVNILRDQNFYDLKFPLVGRIEALMILFLCLIKQQKLIKRKTQATHQQLYRGKRSQADGE